MRLQNTKALVVGKLRVSSRVLSAVVTSLIIIFSQVLVVEPVGAIAARNTQSGVQNSGSSVTVTKPTGTVAGDVMVANILVRTGVAISAPAGWDTAVTTTNGASMTIGTYYKVAGGSEPANYTWTYVGTLNAVGYITAFSGVDNTTPLIDLGTSNSGSSASVSANSVTTTRNNSFIVGGFGQAIETTMTTPTGFTVGNSGAFSSLNTSATSISDVTLGHGYQNLASAGTSGTRTTNTDFIAAWGAQMVALNPVAPTLNQSSYRFSVNVDNNQPHHILNDLSAGNDTLRGSTLDAINNVFYTVGDNGSNWVIERRRIADGSLCTATNCGTTFGTNGRIVNDIASSATEWANAVAVDPSLGFIYVVGVSNAGAGGQWHIEKRDMLTGALVNTFGTSGVVTANPSAGLDEALAIKLDAVNGYIYVGGYDGTGNNQWKLDKYRTDNGNICTAANCGTQFGVNGVYLNNFSNGDDRISNLELDPTNTYIYVSGYDAKNTRTQWTMYKLRADTAAACTAAECGTQFGTAGLYNSDPTTRDDKILTLQVDSAAGSIYLGGFESQGTSASQWRMEKISLTTGVLDNTFGNNGSCSSINTGAVCAVFSSGFDELTNIALDGAGGFIYLLGEMNKSTTVTTDSQWRVQKRSRATGALVSAWATSGTASFNPSANQDPPNSMVVDVDKGVLYAMGGDRTLSSTNMRWRFEELYLDTGTKWLAPANTVGGISSAVTFRLRLLLHVSGTSFNTADNLQYKLQYSPKVGTCDTAFVGESYQDLLTSGTNDLLYHDNPSVTDGTAAVTLSGEDPSHATDTVITQSIEEANNFTASIANIGINQDGMWDFTVKDNGAFGAYCFRAVEANGTLLNTYSSIPEITFCKDDPKTNSLLRHGTYFCEGLKKSFFWTL